MTSNNTPETTAKRPAQGLRRVGLAAFAALALTAGLVAPAASSAATTTSVSIQAEVGGFFGYVSSPDQNCELNRTVTLYKVKHSGLKPIGSDLAQPNGPDSQWFVNTNKKGRFVAKVPASSGCSAATSPIVMAEIQ
jgi:hypothetical protein